MALYAASCGKSNPAVIQNKASHHAKTPSARPIFFLLVQGFSAFQRHLLSGSRIFSKKPSRDSLLPATQRAGLALLVFTGWFRL
jgi:hypothetical protein